MNIMLFAEDPGAVNYIVPIVIALQQQQVSLLLLSAGAATDLFREKGLSPIVISDEKEAIALLHKQSPTFLLTGTSENLDSAGLALIISARNTPTVSVGVIDFNANAAFRFRGRTENPLYFAPDWLLVPDEWTAKTYESIGFLKNKILVVGHPHYDYLITMREKFDSIGRDVIRARLFPEAASNQPVLVFASEISTGLAPEQFRRSVEYTLEGRGKTHGRTEIVVEEFLDAINTLASEELARPYLVLRRHPKETSRDLANYLGEFNSESRGGSPLELIYAADVVVGMSSMLLSEAYALGTPVMSILPRETERDWLALTRMQTIFCAIHREAIQDCLRTLLSTPTYRLPINLAGIPLQVTKRILAFLKSHKTETYNV